MHKKFGNPHRKCGFGRVEKRGLTFDANLGIISAQNQMCRSARCFSAETGRVL